MDWRKPSELRRGVLRNVFARAYIDVGSVDDTIVLAGAGRSGTTWLAYLLAQRYGFRTVFEPFWHLHASVDGIEDFFHHRWIDADDPRYDREIRHVVSGRYRNGLTNHHYSPGPYRGRVVKEICANLFLQRIRAVVPAAPIIFIVRHPCAVVLSRLQRNWGTHAHLFSEQKEYLKRVPSGAPLYPGDDLEEHTITWCHENWLPLSGALTGIGALTVFYEDLVLSRETALDGIFSFIERARAWPTRSGSGSALESWLFPTAHRFEEGKGGPLGLVTSWQRRLDPGQVRRIYGIVERFGLSGVVEQIDGRLASAGA